MAATKLVIVESPAKAATIEGYLGPDYHVTASIGHIRDLPQPSELPADMKKGPYGRFAVDVEDGFTPYYVVNPDKKKKVTELKKLLKESDELFLATDEDREGEAIAWHLLAAWSSTKSRRKRSNALWKILANSTRTLLTPKKLAEFLTGSMATKFRRCCGVRSVPPCPLAACNRSQRAWLWIASATAWRM